MSLRQQLNGRRLTSVRGKASAVGQMPKVVKQDYRFVGVRVEKPFKACPRASSARSLACEAPEGNQCLRQLRKAHLPADVRNRARKNGLRVIVGDVPVGLRCRLRRQQEIATAAGAALKDPDGQYQWKRRPCQRVWQTDGLLHVAHINQSRTDRRSVALLLTAQEMKAVACASKPKKCSQSNNSSANLTGRICSVTARK